MKICKYRVTYGSEIARFSDRLDAMTFAKSAYYSEVRDRTGIIAQYYKGQLAPEFAHVEEGRTNV